MKHITYGPDIELVVREYATVLDDLAGQKAYLLLMPLEPDNRFGMWTQFGELCSQTVSARGLPFDPTTILNQEIGTLSQAYQDFMRLPKPLYRAWLTAAQDSEFPTKSEYTDDPNLKPASIDPKPEG